MLSPSPIPLITGDAQSSISSLNRRWRRGELTRVIPGVYAETTAWTALPPWEKQLTKVHAVMRDRDDVAASHNSAAALRGVTIGGPARVVHLLDPSGTSRRVGAVRTHTTTDKRSVERIDGILLTTTVSTIVDVARGSPPAEGLAYANALMRTEPTVTAEQLRAENESRISSRNRRHARWALSRATGVPESVLESLSLAVIEWAGFELPELQKVFRFDGVEDRGDFYWPSVGVLGEADGAIKYSSELGDPTQAILDEKRRESRLRRHLGGLIRWGWKELKDPDLLIQMLTRAGIPRLHRPDTQMLATVAHFGR